MITIHFPALSFFLLLSVLQYPALTAFLIFQSCIFLPCLLRFMYSPAVSSPFFTALHVMQTRYCDENSVCPSVCHTRGL